MKMKLFHVHYPINYLNEFRKKFNVGPDWDKFTIE